MKDRALYNLFLPGTGTARRRDQSQRRLFESGTLGSGPAAIEDISGDPSKKRISAAFRGKHAQLMYRDVDEIGEISEVSLPFYAIDETKSQTPWSENGYYKVERVENVTSDSRGDDAYIEVDIDLKHVGTHETHYRSLDTTIVQVDHDFGTDLTAYIAAPSDAGKVRWFDNDTEDFESATIVTTRTLEGGDVDIYDADASTFDDPTLIYEADFGSEYVVDPTVWDDYGRTKHQTTADGSTEYNSWQHVFDEDHEYVGQPVADNGALRLYIDEPAGEFTADEWDTATSSWTAVGLDWASTDWALFDWDFTEITPSALRAQILFEHPTNGFYALDAGLYRGADAVQFSIPPNETSPSPSGLQTLLTPIASTSLLDPQMELGLVERSEVRR